MAPLVEILSRKPAADEASDGSCAPGPAEETAPAAWDVGAESSALVGDEPSSESISESIFESMPESISESDQRGGRASGRPGSPQLRQKPLADEAASIRSGGTGRPCADLGGGGGRDC